MQERIKKAFEEKSIVDVKTLIAERDGRLNRKYRREKEKITGKKIIALNKPYVKP